MPISLETLPSTTSLFLDYVHHWDRVGRFYPEAHSMEAVERFARSRSQFSADHRERLASALEEQQRRWGGDTAAAGRFREGAVAVVGGQQPGLFTGPMYTILKAITAVKAARELAGRGIAAVPVFWIASEDHDREEISWAGILDGDSALRKIRAGLTDGEDTPVGWLRFDSSIVATVEECLGTLPPSEFIDDVRSLLVEAYVADRSPVDAFARVMCRLFEGTGLVLMDPLDPTLRGLASEVLGATVNRNGDLRDAVLERSRAISEAGYHEQVRVDANFTGLFAYRGRSRRPLRPGESADVADLSPNVLLRPVVQDSILPTVAYVGGPAEVAYFAQAAPIYECLGKSMPPIFPRISATLVEPPVARILKKYGFEVADAFAGIEELTRRAVGTVHDVTVFDDAWEEVSTNMDRLRSALAGVDATLEGALDNAKQKMKYQVETLRSRFVSASSRRDEILGRQMLTVVGRLYPDRKLQERVINVTAFLGRYGLGLVGMMDPQLTLDGSTHQVIRL